jgi:hypothetical protein
VIRSLVIRLGGDETLLALSVNRLFQSVEAWEDTITVAVKPFRIGFEHVSGLIADQVA